MNCGACRRPFNNPGHGASPVLAGDTLLMVCDQDTRSFLLAMDRQSSRLVAHGACTQRGYATPVLYTAKDGSRQVIVAGSYRLSGYDLKTGREVWWIRRLPWQVKPTPIVENHVVYFVTFSGESDPGQQETVPPFAEALAKMGLNRDGKLSQDEIVDGSTRGRFEEYLDLDETGFLEERVWIQLQERRLVEYALQPQSRRRRRSDRNPSAVEAGEILPNVPSCFCIAGFCMRSRAASHCTIRRPAPS